jgi:two-component sensor histidine kinase
MTDIHREESDRRFRSIFEYVPVAIWEEDISELLLEIEALRDRGITDMRAYLEEHTEEIGRLAGLIEIIDVNEEAVRIMGAGSKEEMLTSLSSYTDEATFEILKEEFVALFEGRSLVEGQTKNLRADGSKIDVLIRIINPPAYDFPDRLLVSTLDISTRVRLEEELKNSYEELRKALEEKEYLLREVYHRVKNNLATVSSLIKLKSSEVEQEAGLSDLDSQVTAIWSLHEKLYQGDQVDKVYLRQYLSELLESIFENLSRLYVKTLVRIDEQLWVDPDTAICLGLITNEVATNAVKYGFSAAEPPEFELSIHPEDDGKRYVMHIGNNGNPFPEDVDFDSSATLGLRLIASLVEQLRGTLDLRKRPTPLYTITFPT